jgi:hypothetical protein
MDVDVMHGLPGRVSYVHAEIEPVRRPLALEQVPRVLREVE